MKKARSNHLVGDMDALRTQIRNMRCSYWTPEHDDEVDFATIKANNKLVEAEHEHLLLPHECTPELQQAASDRLSQFRSDFTQLERKRRRTTLLMSGSQLPTRDTLRGLKCYVVDDTDAHLIISNGWLLFRTYELSEAEVVLTRNPVINCEPPFTKLSGCAVLRGPYLLPPSVFTDGTGSCIR